MSYLLGKRSRVTSFAKTGYVFGSVGLSVCLFVGGLLKTLLMDCNAILWRGLGLYNEELIKF